MLEKLEGYKSVIFFGVALLVAVANLLGFADFQLTAEQSEWFGVIVPLIGLLLRALTKSPIFNQSAG
jgi:hypothetical protein